MYRFLLTPRWWGINVFVLLAIPFCIFMGSWQLSRFEARVQAHHSADEQVETAKKEAARPLADLLPVDQATSASGPPSAGGTASSCWCRTVSSVTRTASTS